MCLHSCHGVSSEYMKPCASQQVVYSQFKQQTWAYERCYYASALIITAFPRTLLKSTECFQLCHLT